MRYPPLPVIRSPFALLSSRKHVIHYYLLNIRFPDWELHVRKHELESGATRQLKPGTSRYEIVEYWKKLLSTPETELREMFDVARAQGQWRIDVESKVSAYLPDFDYRDAIADFSSWALLPFWTAEEGVALTLGKDPRRVTWARVEPYVDVHPLAAQFGNRLDLLEREQEVGELQEKIVPADFIEWARGKIDLAPGLEEAVKALPKRRPSRKDAEQIDTRERSTLLKLVEGLAVVFCSHNPDSERPSTAPTIVTKLANEGYHINETTVRKYLKEAKEKQFRRKSG